MVNPVTNARARPFAHPRAPATASPTRGQRDPRTRRRGPVVGGEPGTARQPFVFDPQML